MSCVRPIEIIVQIILSEQAHTVNCTILSAWRNCNKLGVVCMDEKNQNNFDEDLLYSNEINADAVSYKKETGAYIFCGKEFFDLESLLIAMAINWDEAIKDLESGKISDFFIVSASHISKLANKCVNDVSNADKALQRFICEVYPDAPMMWKGRIFKSFEEIQGELLLEKNYLFFVDMLRQGAFTEYLKNNQSKRTMYNKVYKIEGELKTENISGREALFMLKYALNNDPCFVFNGEKFRNVDEFLDYLMYNIDNIDIISKDLIENELFIAWLRYLDYDEAVEKWQIMISRGHLKEFNI